MIPADEMERLSYKTRPLFSYHRREAIAITDAILAKIFQGQRDHCAEQMLQVSVNALREFWQQPDNAALLNDDLAELKRLKEQART